MAHMDQHRRRRGSNNSVSPEDPTAVFQLPDLRQVAVLTRHQWQRIQDDMHQVDREKERMREAAKRREALHLEFREKLKLGSNSIMHQKQKKLQAKKIREEIEEEKRKLIDIEEAKYKEQKRKEAVEKARTQRLYQTDRFKGLHSALLLTEVYKERGAQIELKQKAQSAVKDVDKEFLDMEKARDEEALRREQEKSEQKKLERKAIAEDLKSQVREKELVREQQKMENKKEGEEIQRVKELYLWEQRMESEKQATQKKNLMQSHLEHITNRDLMRAIEAQRQAIAEEERKLFLSTKQKMMKLRKEKEKELFTEYQARRERIINKLTVNQKEEETSEEQKIARAVAEREARQTLQQLEEEERKAAMLISITEHRERMKREKEDMDKMLKQKAEEELQAKKEADKIFSEKQEQKAKKIRETERNMKDFNAALMAAKSAREQQLMDEEHEYQVRKAELLAEEEKQFQEYSQQVIGAVTEAQGNVIPLCKAAREGFGGGQGPVCSGVRPSYLVQDSTGAQMPNYVSGAAKDIKKLHVVADIQDAKMRLGFLW